MGKCQGDCGIPQPSLQSEDMPRKPLDVSTPLFYPRAEEQQASLPGEQPRDADAARIHKSVRVCSHMVHQSTALWKTVGLFFVMCVIEKQCGVRHRGREQGVSVALRTDRQQSPSGALLARGRVPNRVHQGTALRKTVGLFFVLCIIEKQCRVHHRGRECPGGANNNNK